MNKKYMLFIVMIVILSLNVFGTLNYYDGDGFITTGSESGRGADGVTFIANNNVILYNVSDYLGSNNSEAIVKTIGGTQIANTTSKVGSVHILNGTSGVRLDKNSQYSISQQIGGSGTFSVGSYTTHRNNTDIYFMGRLDQGTPDTTYWMNFNNFNTENIPIPQTPLNFTYTKTCYFNGTGLSLNLMSGCY